MQQPWFEYLRVAPLKEQLACHFGAYFEWIVLFVQENV